MSGLTVLVVGASGSIGRYVVAEAVAAGHSVRALVRDRARANGFDPEVDVVVGDVTHPETLRAVVGDIDAVVFTLGSDGTGKDTARAVDYEGVRNVLDAIGDRPVRVALMTTIGVTDREDRYNLDTEVHDWKRRSERFVRASGLVYTIVRPSWFDRNAPGQHRLVFLQGDLRRSGTPADGVVARVQIAQVLVASLTSEAARNKTLELVAEDGPAQPDLEPLFAALESDPDGSLDAVKDAANMPLGQEPAAVVNDLIWACRP